ncbi:MAG: hypothetical protein SFH39_12245 [Candidatus Magnetobacterium sp. LHC-1]|nr:hypothetical protein [Nitrospirota bacterium]
MTNNVRQAIVQRIATSLEESVDDISVILAKEGEVTLNYKISIKQENYDLNINMRQSYSKGNVKSYYTDNTTITFGEDKPINVTDMVPYKPNELAGN